MNNENLMNDIKEQLTRYGKLSIIFYKMNNEYVIHKWGEFEQLMKIHEKRFIAYKLAGFDEEADSLTLMELPKDANVIYRILTCGSLVEELKEIGVELK